MRRTRTHEQADATRSFTTVSPRSSDASSVDARGCWRTPANRPWRRATRRRSRPDRRRARCRPRRAVFHAPAIDAAPTLQRLSRAIRRSTPEGASMGATRRDHRIGRPDRNQPASPRVLARIPARTAAATATDRAGDPRRLVEGRGQGDREVVERGARRRQGGGAFVLHGVLARADRAAADAAVRPGHRHADAADAASVAGDVAARRAGRRVDRRNARAGEQPEAGLVGGVRRARRSVRRNDGIRRAQGQPGRPAREAGARRTRRSGRRSARGSSRSAS